VACRRPLSDLEFGSLTWRNHDGSVHLGHLDKSIMPSCPPPFLDDAPYPSHQGNIYGRLCSNVLPLASPNTTCCLPCPVQNYVLRHSSLNALHVNDMVNVIGFVIGIFILLVCLTSAEVNIHSTSALLCCPKTLPVEACWRSLSSSRRSLSMYLNLIILQLNQVLSDTSLVRITRDTMCQ